MDKLDKYSKWLEEILDNSDIASPSELSVYALWEINETLKELIAISQ
jgi:hypothetical protein